MRRTTIAINKNTREELKFLGKKYEDYDAIINKCINFTKKFENEHQFHEWFKNNFSLIGFDGIKEERIGRDGSPDFIMIRGNKEVRVELETLSGNFLLHKHDPKRVDLVVCLVKDKELPVKTVEITPFEFDTKTTIQISQDLKQKLKLLATVGSTTYNGVIEELIEQELKKRKLDAVINTLKKTGNNKRKRKVKR